MTEENKYEYVKQVCYARMGKEIELQLKAFLEGFHELIPSSLISIFSSKELELMISGLPDIDSNLFYYILQFIFYHFCSIGFEEQYGIQWIHLKFPYHPLDVGNHGELRQVRKSSFHLIRDWYFQGASRRILPTQRNGRGFIKVYGA